MVFRPDTFGKYVLLKRIAVGGMAEVFRAKAFGAEGFEKLVAIKRMLPHLSSDQQFVGMFINEAKLTASLNHANIAQIYDFGCIENLYFLSMEYVHGKDLADLIRMLRDQSLSAPVELACHVIIGVLNGLDYAHRKTDAYGNTVNLIHRDTSPHNLIISYEGEVKIVDFGIAKAKSTTVQTTGGVLKGKYSYMSPEQAHGMSLDHRSDLFSLAICFYELLTLTKMFQGSSDLSVLEKVRETNFIPPRQLNEAIPVELENLLLKALEKNPADRWASAAEWREELEGFLYHSGLHYSTAWLSGFMNEIFRVDFQREAQELAEEAEVAVRMRTGARRMARLDAIRDTVVLKREEDGSFGSVSATEHRPPIREVGEDEYEEYEPPAFQDTARAATPLGQIQVERNGRIRRLDAQAEPDEFAQPMEIAEEDLIEALPGDQDLRSVDELDDDSLPTMEVSRPAPVGNRIPPRQSPIREVASDRRAVAGRPDEDSSEIDTLDERSQPRSMPSPPVATPGGDFGDTHLDRGPERTGESALNPSDFTDDAATLKQRRARPESAAVALEESTSRQPTRRGPLLLVAIVLVAALGTGVSVALWPQLTEPGTEAAPLDAGLASGGPVLAQPELPATGLGADAGALAAGMEPLRPPPDPTTNPEAAVPDAGTPTGGADPIRVAEVPGLDGPDPDPGVVAVQPEPDKPKPPTNSRPLPTQRRRRQSACASHGYGAVDVGVSGGWAWVYVDGRKLRATPLLNYRLKAGRHKVELRDGGDRLVRRWNICLKNNGKVKLLHQ